MLFAKFKAAELQIITGGQTGGDGAVVAARLQGVLINNALHNRLLHSICKPVEIELIHLLLVTVAGGLLDGLSILGDGDGDRGNAVILQ